VEVGFFVGGVDGGVDGGAVAGEVGGILLGEAGGSLAVGVDVDVCPTRVAATSRAASALHPAAAAMIASVPVTTTARLKPVCILVPHLNATLDD
jgi:hypothetical protein